MDCTWIVRTWMNRGLFVQEDDPISLEPLNELAYPPFDLATQSGARQKHHFDGRVLAYFMVSTASFMDPLSR